jgi:hypothetical protein
MSHLRPVRLVGALLAVAAVSALTTVGIALAQGGQHHARRGRSHHAAKASARGNTCPAPSTPKEAGEARAAKEAARRTVGATPASSGPASGAEKEEPVTKPAGTPSASAGEKEALAAVATPASVTEKEALRAAGAPCTTW